MRLSEVKTDVSKQQQGTWITYSGEGESEVKFKLARIGNSDYESMLHAKMRAAGLSNKKKFSKAQMKVIEDITLETVAEKIVLDWSNIQDEEGKDLQYSPENCKKIMLDPAYRDFANDIVKLANDVENFRASEDASDLKN